MICNPGELKDSLNIKEYENITNSFGMLQKVLISSLKLRCKLKKANVERESISANKVINKQTCTFLVSTRKKLNCDMVLEYKTENYNITNIINYNNNFYEITCEVVR